MASEHTSENVRLALPKGRMESGVLQLLKAAEAVDSHRVGIYRYYPIIDDD